MNKKVLKVSGIILGSMFLSTLGIFAADSLNGIDRSMVGLTGVGTGTRCREGMVLTKVNGSMLCADLYEASPASTCPHQNPSSVVESEKNVSSPNCYAASVKGAVPWRYVSLTQAQRVCAQSGKRLPTPEEWYQLALGTESLACVVDKNDVEVAGTDSCVSSTGVYDMVGNVWEWIEVTVVGNEYGGRALPPTGYVSSVDTHGIAITSGESGDTLYGEDYFWSKEEGVFGMIRGGFYGSKNDAGLYAVNATVATSFASQGVGFRCVEDVL